MVVSTYATVALEKIAKIATQPLWLQLYVNPDRGFTRELVERARTAGYRALCVTADSPVFGTRNREMRTGFRLPRGMAVENLKPLGRKHTSGHGPCDGVYSPLVDPSLQWKDVDWLCSFAKLPVVLKGILAPEDARLAVEHGAGAVIVSNHGGRNLDTLPATIEALPGVAEAIDGRLPVLLDGGIRRGTDVVKALALGARAVLIGRPYIFASGFLQAQARSATEIAPSWRLVVP